jgi:hypothetical protein
MSYKYYNIVAKTLSIEIIEENHNNKKIYTRSEADYTQTYATFLEKSNKKYKLYNINLVEAYNRKKKYWEILDKDSTIRTSFGEEITTIRYFVSKLDFGNKFNLCNAITILFIIE